MDHSSQYLHGGKGDSLGQEQVKETPDGKLLIDDKKDGDDHAHTEVENKVHILVGTVPTLGQSSGWQLQDDVSCVGLQSSPAAGGGGRGER